MVNAASIQVKEAGGRRGLRAATIGLTPMRKLWLGRLVTPIGVSRWRPWWRRARLRRNISRCGTLSAMRRGRMRPCRPKYGCWCFLKSSGADRLKRGLSTTPDFRRRADTRSGWRANIAVSFPPPLRTWCLPACPGACHSQWLQTTRRRRSGRNGTSPTRSPPCDASSSRQSSCDCLDVHAVISTSARVPGVGN